MKRVLEINDLCKAVADLCEGGDDQTESVVRAFEIMRKYGYIDEDGMFSVPEDVE